MGQFYIEVEDELSDGTKTSSFYELTLTEEITVNYSASVSSHPTETGNRVSDHKVNSNTRISFRGLISDIKNLLLPPIPSKGVGEDKTNLLNTQRSVEENMAALERIHRENKLFKTYYDSRRPALNNCVFTILDFTRNNSTGTAYRVNLSIEENKLSGRARFINQPETSIDVKDQAEVKTNSSSNSTEKGDVVKVGFAEVGDDIRSAFNFTTGG